MLLPHSLLAHDHVIIIIIQQPDDRLRQYLAESIAR